MANTKYAKEKDQLLTSLIKQTKKKGFIQSETIINRFGRYKPSEDELEEYYATFLEAGIEVVFSEDEDENFSAEEFDHLPSDGERKTLEASNDSMDTLKAYLNDVGKEPTLTRKELSSLIIKMRAGDEAARELVIKCHLRYAFLIAAKYAATGYPIQDLIQQASIGLIMAADHFDPSRGPSFSAYCTFWIKRYIIAYIEEETRLVRLPHHICVDLGRVKSARETFYMEYMHYPTDSEVATILDFPISKVKRLTGIDFSYISTESKPDNNNEGTLLDTLASDDNFVEQVYNMDFKSQLMMLVEKLPERERKIMMLHYGLNSSKAMTLDEIGCELGITRERVRQLENRALKLLRAMPGTKELYDYLN